MAHGRGGVFLIAQHGDINVCNLTLNSDKDGGADGHSDQPL